MSNISDKNGWKDGGDGRAGGKGEAEGKERDMEDFEVMNDRNARLVAHALGELEGAELAAVEAELAASPEARAELARIEATLGLVEDALADTPRMSDAGRAATLAAARPAHGAPWWRRPSFAAAASVVALAGGALGWIYLFQPATFGSGSDESFGAPADAMLVAKGETGSPMRSLDLDGSGSINMTSVGTSGADNSRWDGTELRENLSLVEPVAAQSVKVQSVTGQVASGDEKARAKLDAMTAGLHLPRLEAAAPGAPSAGAVGGPLVGGGGGGAMQPTTGGVAHSYGGRKVKSRAASEAPASQRPASAGPSSAGPAGAGAPATTAGDARLQLGRQASTSSLAASTPPGAGGEGALSGESPQEIGAVVAFEEDMHVPAEQADRAPISRERQVEAEFQRLLGGCLPLPGELPRDMYFRFWGDNPFEVSLLDKQSTFGVDVDTASYSLARRYVQEGRLPEKAQVRTEEFVNYFKAESAAPTNAPFAIHVELAPSRFGGDQARQMLRVVVRAKDLAHFERKPLRLTFVVDVSGSMREQNRLETVKDSLRLLVAQLEPGDRIAIVKYSNDAAVVSAMASVSDKVGFETAIQSLSPEGGTNSNAGLQLGYALAVEGFDPECVNRVVFLSDGVANQGVTDPRQIAEGLKPLKEKGILLNTIGVGMNNHNDVLLEQLADTCDGVCTYVDTPKEAKRALVDNFTGMFQPVGRDAKVQVEFDPTQVRRWRQLGYENRAIADADFRNDQVDAGEINAGHEMTALYELEMATPRADAPLAVVRLRWKDPRSAGRGAEADAAREMEAPVAWSRRVGFAGASHGYRRAAIAAQYAEFLRLSTHADGDRVEDLLAEARALRVERPGDADWTEFVEVVERAAKLGLGAKVGCDELCELEMRLRQAHWRRHERERLKVSGATPEVDDHDQAIERLERELRRLVEQRVEGR